MVERSVAQTQKDFSSLLLMVEGGQDVVITRDGKPVAKLIQVIPAVNVRKLGPLAGQGWIAEDFDAPCPEIEESVYGNLE